MILIDKEELLKLPYFQQGRFDKENGSKHYKAAWETFKLWIEKQPTYDTDKVIEAVKAYGDYVSVNDVCKIIENGGL